MNQPNDFTCKICGALIIQQMRYNYRTRGIHFSWIHLKEWQRDKDHQAEPTILEYVPSGNEWAWW